MRPLAYIPTFNTVDAANEQDRIEKAFVSYATSRGWPEMKSENWAIGVAIEEAVARLSAGDVLLLQSIAHISEKPSVQERIILTCIANGVRVHVLSLSGPIEPHLLALSEAWFASKAIEAARDLTEAKMVQLVKKQEKDMAEFENEVMSNMAVRFGVQNLLKGFDRSEQSNPVGSDIKRRREAKGWSQQQLAEMVGVSKAQISRLELLGKAEALEKVLAVLGSDKALPVAGQMNGKMEEHHAS